MSSYMLVQISDVHLTASGTMPPGVRPRDSLLSGLRLLRSAGLRPDVFLLTGDLTDAGDPACYDDLAQVMADAARWSGADVVCLPGNHDDRGVFRRHLLGDGSPGGSGDGPVNQTRWRGGLRIIALDSTIPGQPGGALDQPTLAYLADELRTPAPDGTVVALHHPPIPSPVQVLSRIALSDAGPLARAIAGTDVRIVLAGHYHHAELGTLGPVPVWVSPATAYLTDTASTGEFRRLPASSFSRIDLTEAGPVATVLPVP